MEKITPILDIIRTLRGENGCSWDRKQTPLSLWKCLAEEVYELQEGLAREDLVNICEEMGDVLFQILFIMEIFHDTGQIPFDRTVDMVARKMIRRHPHVYGDAKVTSEDELYRQWDQIKAAEKQSLNGTGGMEKSGSVLGRGKSSALNKVPSGMTSLVRALKVSKCAVKKGFDWEDIHGVLASVKDEIREFEDALAEEDIRAATLEFGDILFSLVNVARSAGFHPETALALSTAKFEKRFRIMENMLDQEDLDLSTLSPEEKDRFWEGAKALLRAQKKAVRPSPSG